MSNVFGPKKPLFAPYTYRAKQDSNGNTLLAVYHGSKRIAHDAVRHLGYDAVRFHESAETVRSLGLARKGEVTVAVLDPARLHVAPPPRGTLGSLLWHLDRSRK